MSPPWAWTPCRSSRSGELIRELGERHTVILSSHILSEVQTHLRADPHHLPGASWWPSTTPEALEKRMLRPEQIRPLAEVRTDRETAEAVLASVPGLAGWDLPAAEDGVMTG